MYIIYDGYTQISFPFKNKSEVIKWFTDNRGVKKSEMEIITVTRKGFTVRFWGREYQAVKVGRGN